MAWRHTCGEKHKDQWTAAHLAVQVQLSTFGGRGERTQVRAESVRLCEGCIAALESGKVPKTLRAALSGALDKINKGGKQ